MAQEHRLVLHTEEDTDVTARHIGKRRVYAVIMRVSEALVLVFTRMITSEYVMHFFTAEAFCRNDGLLLCNAM